MIDANVSESDAVIEIPLPQGRNEYAAGMLVET
jgi:hypothetical protein